MTVVPVISADTLRACVGFQDLIEPMAHVFQEPSSGRADAKFLAIFHAERPELGDVYIKTGSVRGFPIFVVKISPWFAANVASGNTQGGFIAVLEAQTGHTLAILAEDHYLSDIAERLRPVLPVPPSGWKPISSRSSARATR